MNVHEYQAKEVLRKYGVPIPDFGVIRSVEDLEAVLKKLSTQEAVLKVQIHAGGRGKAGGVKFAKSKEEIYSHAKNMLGMKIVNNQTGKDGVVAHQLMISLPVDIEKEYYLGAIIDRQKGEALLIASPEGGMEIEEVAHKTPEKILKMPIPLDGILSEEKIQEVGKFLGWNDALIKKGAPTIAAVAKAFIDTDASLLEINPLVLTKQNEIVALDAKLGVDDNALYRQTELAEFFDPTQVSPQEVRAKKFDLAYIALDGDIGCMVNGAGLAMATMDIIQHYGGKPANFLDVGGGASQEKVAEGFKIILEDPKVKAILVNIFGGIMNCETLAAGIIAAAKELQVKVPLIVRMEGTNVEQGKKMLKESRLNITIANGLAEAAQTVVKAAKGS